MTRKEEIFQKSRVLCGSGPRAVNEELRWTCIGLFFNSHISLGGYTACVS
jgi:hypothetical protein